MHHQATPQVTDIEQAEPLPETITTRHIAILFNQGQYTAVMELCNLQIQNRTQDYVTYYYLGRCKEQLHNYKEAIANYLLCADARPGVDVNAESMVNTFATHHSLNCQEKLQALMHQAKLRQPSWCGLFSTRQLAAAAAIAITAAVTAYATF